MKRSQASVALALSTLLLFAAAPLVHAGGVPPVTGETRIESEDAAIGMKFRVGNPTYAALTMRLSVASHCDNITKENT